MVDTITAKLGLTKPEIGASANSWGNKLNANLDILDGKVIYNTTQWAMALGDGVADSTAGPFVVTRYNNAGVVQDNPFTINRQTGYVTVLNMNVSGKIDAPAGGPLTITANPLTVIGAVHAISAAVTNALSAASAAITGHISAATATLSGAFTAASAFVTGAFQVNGASIFNGNATFNYPNNTTFHNLAGAITSANQTGLCVASGASGQPVITFLSPNAWGAQFGMANNGDFYMGGFTHGATAYKFWTSKDFSAVPAANPVINMRTTGVLYDTGVAGAINIPQGHLVEQIHISGGFIRAYTRQLQWQGADGLWRNVVLG